MSFASVAVVRLSENGGYMINHFPPVHCATSNSNFYTNVLPLNISAAVSLCQLLVIGWVIHKVCECVCVCVCVCICVCVFFGHLLIMPVGRD